MLQISSIAFLHSYRIEKAIFFQVLFFAIKANTGKILRTNYTETILNN